MGIDTDWINKALKKIAPNAFIKKMKRSFDVVISDLTETVYGFLKQKDSDKTFVKLQNKIRKNLETEYNTNESLKSYVLLIDNIENAIFCKSVTRLLDREKTCFTLEEMVNLGIYEEISIPSADEDDSQSGGSTVSAKKKVVRQLSVAAKHAIIGNEPEKYWMTKSLRKFIEETVRDVTIETVSGTNFHDASKKSSERNAKIPNPTVCEKRAARYGIKVILDDVPKREKDYCKNELDDEFERFSYNHIDPESLKKVARGIYIMNHIDKSKPGIHTVCHSGIGEADIKFLEYIHPDIGNSYCFKSKDSDWILILLLSMEKFIDPKTGNIPFKFYIDRTHAFDNYFKCEREGKLKEGRDYPDCFVDVVALWQGIISYMEKEYPNIKNPIESFVALMLLSGSDFVYDFGILSRFEQRTKSITERRSNEGGGAELAGPDAIDHNPSNVITANKLWTLFESNSDFRACMSVTESGRFIYRNVPLAGEKYALKTVLVNEKRLYDMVLMVYKSYFEGFLTTEKVKQIETFCDLEFAFMQMKHKKGPTKHMSRVEIPTDDMVRANVRRLNFNITYWIRSHVPHFKLHLPTTSEVPNRLEGLPKELRAFRHLYLFGWKLIPLDYKNNQFVVDENLTLVVAEGKPYLCVMTNDIIPYSIVSRLATYHSFIRHHGDV